MPVDKQTTSVELIDILTDEFKVADSDSGGSAAVAAAPIVAFKNFVASNYRFQPALGGDQTVFKNSKDYMEQQGSSVHEVLGLTFA